MAAEGGQAYSVVLTAPPAPVLSDGFDTGFRAWTVKGELRLDPLRGSPIGSAPSARGSGANRKSGAWRALPVEQQSACLGAWVRPGSVGERPPCCGFEESRAPGSPRCR